MGKLKYALDEVLSFNIEPRNRATVRRYYYEWRRQHGLSERCDNPKCHFHVEPLVWNSTPLSVILDHENGNSLDNRPDNLRLLCPNCDAQLETRGGGNKGRIQNLGKTGFEVAHKSGRRDALIAPEGLEAKVNPETPAVDAKPDKGQ